MPVSKGKIDEVRPVSSLGHYYDGLHLLAMYLHHTVLLSKELQESILCGMVHKE